MTQTLTQEVRNVAMTDPRFLAEEIKPPRPITVLHRANPHRVCTMNHSDTDTDQGGSDPCQHEDTPSMNHGLVRMFERRIIIEHDSKSQILRHHRQAHRQH